MRERHSTRIRTCPYRYHYIDSGSGFHRCLEKPSPGLKFVNIVPSPKATFKLKAKNVIAFLENIESSKNLLILTVDNDSQEKIKLSEDLNLEIRYYAFNKLIARRR